MSPLAAADRAAWLRRYGARRERESFGHSEPAVVAVAASACGKGALPQRPRPPRAAPARALTPALSEAEIAQAERDLQGLDRIADAIRLFIDDAACKLEIEQKIVLPAPLRKAVDRSNAERARAQEAEADAASATKEAVKAALGAGLSTRDAGALLGLTRQRVQQVASGR